MILRKLRILISILVFVLFLFIFSSVDNHLAQPIANFLAFFQFIPSITKFIFAGVSITSIGFILILLLTLLFGRVYCSTLCPLGILQDFIIHIFKKNKKFSFSCSYNLLRYSIFTITIVSFLVGTLIIINFLDPFSFLGKIITDIIKPVLTLKNFKIYSSQTRITFTIILPTSILLIIFLIMSITRGRLYCNSICPVGVILGVISKYSLCRIFIDKEKCTSCKLCEIRCKAGCIDSKNKFVDLSRCVFCFNCLNSCPQNALAYNFKMIKNYKKLNYSRRKFLLNLFAYSFSIFSLFQLRHFINDKKLLLTNVKKTPITPPGSLSIEHFTYSCTACHLCVSICPSKVITPSLLEYGLTGIMQPHLDYSQGYCEFECNACSLICPSGAIKPISIEEKKRTQLGIVKFIKENCIVYSQGRDCCLCCEYCPTQAVYPIKYKNLYAPQINPEICIGCGACEFICPARPHKAMRVEGNKVHKKVKPPQ